jgi:hypothetical protein
MRPGKEYYKRGSRTSQKDPFLGMKYVLVLGLRMRERGGISLRVFA